MKLLLAISIFLSGSTVLAQCPNCGNNTKVQYNVPPAIQYIVPPTVQYNVRVVTRNTGPTWTWPGSIANHLQATHGQSVAGLSHAEMVALHDNLHNSVTRSKTVVRTRRLFFRR